MLLMVNILNVLIEARGSVRSLTPRSKTIYNLIFLSLSLISSAIWSSVSLQWLLQNIRSVPSLVGGNNFLLLAIEPSA
jgi:hypothetical protein